MKQFFNLLFLSILISLASCSEKIENTVLPKPPADSTVVTNGLPYYINITIGDTTLVLKNDTDNVGNGVYKQQFGACSGGETTTFTSYFAYVSDTSRKELIAFGLTNCVNDTANGINDSTYYVSSFPLEISYPDTSTAFINYLDADSVLWSSAMGQNGLSPQVSHSFNVSQVNRNLDGISNLMITGNFTGWVYNLNGDSLLVSRAEFYSRAWAL